jgi:hypothetical protein
MKTNTRFIVAVLAVICMISIPFASVVASEDTHKGAKGTITGKVTEDFQLIADDGEVYAINDNEESKNLMEHVGETVKVTGMLNEEDGEITITVTDFTVLQE